MHPAVKSEYLGYIWCNRPGSNEVPIFHVDNPSCTSYNLYSMRGRGGIYFATKINIHTGTEKMISVITSDCNSSVAHSQ